jgi:hypothetical protein
VRPFVNLEDGSDRLLWEGQALEREDSSGFADAVDAATNAVLETTMGLDFAEIDVR